MLLQGAQAGTWHHCCGCGLSTYFPTSNEAMTDLAAKLSGPFGGRHILQQLVQVGPQVLELLLRAGEAQESVNKDARMKQAGGQHTVELLTLISESGVK